MYGGKIDRKYLILSAENAQGNYFLPEEEVRPAIP